MEWAFSCATERAPFESGLRQKVLKTSAASTRVSRALHHCGRDAPRMRDNRSQTEQVSPAYFCISLNPAIDTRLVLDELRPGQVNRAKEVQRASGGKAAHVAMALKGLGATPTWI